MPIIRTRCPRCGDVDLEASALMIFVRHRNARQGNYRFTCPECFHVIEKQASERIIALLVASGVEIVMVGEEEGGRGDEVPATERPPLTLDDLIDFHFALQDDARIARELFGA